MDLYTRIDLLVLALPLALSFDRKVAFWRSWPQAFPAIAVVMAVFIPWDVWKTTQGVWGFNPEYAGEIRWLHLPPGEWLFRWFWMGRLGRVILRATARGIARPDSAASTAGVAPSPIVPSPIVAQPSAATPASLEQRVAALERWRDSQS